ncbi:hypothetical protein N9R59_06080 [Porticoccaceae bacterium]|nr:hypothetical protein [Porticoccaceae bacterium]
MKKLLITLSLISPFSFADWGDVYYCQMTTSSATTNEGKRTDYELEKFQFKLDSTEKAMVFGKGGYFNKWKITLDLNRTFFGDNSWWASNMFTLLHFSEGQFMLSFLGSEEMTSISANCDKF